MSLQFADFEWPERWNRSAGAVAALSQSGASVMATGFFGVIRFQLDDDVSVAAIVSHARQFADMVESAKRAFDGVCDRCGRSPAPRLSSEVCRACAPVPLCGDCLELHSNETESPAH